MLYVEWGKDGHLFGSFMQSYECKKFHIDQSLYIYKILVLAHSKYYTSESPVTSFYQTRFSENSLDCPNYVTASGQKTIDYKMATFWNGLPLTTRKLTNMEDFKATVKTTLLNREIGL